MNSNSAIPTTDQRPSPPVLAPGILTLVTGPSQASRAWRALRWGDRSGEGIAGH